MIGAGEELYLAYRDKVSAYIRSKVENHHDAEDLVAQVFEKVYGKRHTFDESKASVSTWIYTITRNTVADHFRTKKNHLEFSDTVQWEEIPQEEGDERLEQLADALQQLKPRERDLIILYYYKGYTLKVVAEMMQMSYINTKVLHKKALSKMRDYYLND